MPCRPRTPTASPQGQDEFYFALPYHRMDLALWAFEHGVPEAELASFLDIQAKQASFIYKDIAAKRLAARYLHASAVLVETIAETAKGQ